MSLPLIGVVTLIYVGVSVAEFYAGRSGMAVTFFGYALANVGLMYQIGVS